MRRLVGITLMAGALAITGCEATGRHAQTQNVSNPRPVHCTVHAESPKRDAEPAQSIVARARFRCDRPGAEVMTVTVRLEKRGNGSWTTIRSQSFTVRGEQTHAEFFKYQHRQLTAGCGAGRFRTVVDWSRRSRGATTTHSTRSGNTIDPCAPRLFT